MAKQPKKEVKKADGSFHNPFPWLPPYPASKVEAQDPKDEDNDGVAETEEKVYVRASVNQDITVNGVKYAVGERTLPAFVAHAHSHAISAPKSKE